MGVKRIMTKNKKIILFAICIIIVIAGITVATLALNNKTKNVDTSGTTSSDVPKTAEDQNKMAAEAFQSALVAINNSNAAEAKKQLDIALKLYSAAKNEDGINNVNSQYPIVEAIPAKPETPTPSPLKSI